jgi:hypothetical protein
MREELVKGLGMAAGSLVMKFEGSQLRRKSCCVGRKKDLLATPFQRCLEGVVLVPVEVVVMPEEMGVEVEVELKCA